jgi:hypothetical protein
MSWLAENSFAIWALGAIALAGALAVFWETRAPKALAAIGIIILITAGLLVTEWIIETPREAVTRTLKELAATVEANDVNGTLAFLSPKAAKMRADVEKLMPEVQIEMARIINGPEVEFNQADNPTQAVARLRGAIRGKVKNTSMQGTVPDDLQVTLEYDGQRWLISDYTSQRNWQQQLRRP